MAIKMNVFVPRGRYATISQNENKIANGKKFHLKKISIQGKKNPRNSKVSVYMFQFIRTIFLRVHSLLRFGRFSFLQEPRVLKFSFLSLCLPSVPSI